MNKRVIQDHDAAKNVAWKQALERHEAQLAKTKDFNEKVVKRHFQQIKSDEGLTQEEIEIRRVKQKRFYEDIRGQMDNNVSKQLLR